MFLFLHQDSFSSTIMKSCVRLCTFDVTNTLLKFRIPVGEQYSRVGCMYGVQKNPDLLTKAFLHHWKLLNSEHPNYGLHNGLTSKMWWKELINRVFSADGLKVSSNQLESISNHLYNLYKTDECWEVTSGAKPLLSLLKEKNITLGVISNFDERLDTVLSSTGLKSYFSFILASYVVRTEKPSKEIFQMALDQVPGLSPSDALHVGDNVTLDYFAAKQAGWKAVLIATPKLTPDSLKQVEAEDLVQDVRDLEHTVMGPE